MITTHEIGVSIADKTNRIGLIFFLLAATLYSSAAAAQELIDPLIYPQGVISSSRPSIIWQDIYNERDRNYKVRYRITLKKPDRALEKPLVLTVQPKIYFRNYYVYPLPGTLAADRYEYTIERMLDRAPTDASYYHFLKYPIKKEFTIGTGKTPMDGLRPEKQIEYIFLDRNNRLINENNFYFYTGASALSFGIGLLFFQVIRLGIVSKIVYVTAFASSAVMRASTP